MVNGYIKHSVTVCEFVGEDLTNAQVNKKKIKINWLNSDVCSGLCVIPLCTGNKTLDLQTGSLSVLHINGDLK